MPEMTTLEDYLAFVARLLDKPAAQRIVTGKTSVYPESSFWADGEAAIASLEIADAHMEQIRVFAERCASNGNDLTALHGAIARVCAEVLQRFTPTKVRDLTPTA